MESSSISSHLMESSRISSHSMESSSISSHYNSVPGHYSSAWWSQPAYTTQIDSLLLHYLRLQPTSRLVDLGAGTGELAQVLKDRANLAVPVLCVDPSQGMLDLADAREGVRGLCMGAEEWSDGGEDGDCDRVVVKQAVHHFDRARLPQTLAGIWRRLSPGGYLVIEKAADTYGDEKGFSEKVTNIMDRSLIGRVEFEKLLKCAGFQLVESHRHQFVVTVAKKDLFASYRNRVLSALSLLSDQEIEEEIRGIDAKHPGEMVNFINTRDFMVGCKLA